MVFTPPVRGWFAAAWVDWSEPALCACNCAGVRRAIVSAPADVLLTNLLKMMSPLQSDKKPGNRHDEGRPVIGGDVVKWEAA